MPNTFNLTKTKAFLHVIMGIIIFLVTQIAASLSYLFVPNAILAEIINDAVRIVMLFFCLSIYCKKVIKISLRQCRVCKPDTFTIWGICAFALPALVCCFFLFCIPGVFAKSELTSQQLINRIIISLFGTCITAGITEELVFRGFIMRILEARWGKTAAILIPSFIFGLLHILNIESPNALDIVSLLIAGTAVGIMFSLIAYQSGSIWPGAFVHGVWNFIVIGGIIDIGLTHYDDAIYTYTLTSESNIVTGGAFGIESSLPAIAGYLTVIIIALFLIRRIKSGKDKSI